MTKKYGIIGWPLGHTLSPTLHTWGFDQLGIDATYEAWPLESGDVSTFMKRVRTEPISGVSVTIPHKQAIMKSLDYMTDRARTVGAANTLYWDNDLLCGENTDITGLIAPLAKLAKLPDSAMVLGAGGAARAAIVGLQELGIDTISLSNRTQSRAETLAVEFSVRNVAWDKRTMESPGLIINTTPMGMCGHMEKLTPWQADSFPSGTVVYDIVYNPLKTRLLKEAQTAGCVTISGLEMFLHQGLAQFKLWTGQDMDENGARTVLLSVLNS
ncbi:MAG: shikimate dehydrogenase [Pseudodesulfovibrio sp.]|nr:shikimate dehydrogenase [Pseudodesulfovibrio sp.]